VGIALGATTFRDEMASAAAAVLRVSEQNVDAHGDIKVHEQGTAAVNVANTPSVKLEQRTAVLFDQDVAKRESRDIDVGSAREVRLMASLNDCHLLDAFDLRVFTVGSHGAFMLDEVDRVPCGGLTKTYELPGVVLRVEITEVFFNESPVHVEVLGRP